MAQITTLQGKTYFVVNPIGLAELLYSPAGVVARAIIDKAERVKQKAIEIAPVGKPVEDGPPRDHPPGNLRDHIVKRVVTGPKGVTCLVGVWGVPYALPVHEGAAQHQIPGNPLLVFFWPKGPEGARVYTFRSVNHPGNQPNRFLVRALQAVNE